jgi:hypothetical protein
VRGVSIGFDANPELGWIQVLRNNASEIRDLQIQPLGGNVGIGTTSPLSKLHVRDNSGADLISYIQNAGAGRAVMRLDSGNGATTDIRLAQAGADKWSILANGSSFFLIRDETNSVYRLAIDSSGNVGIGTTNPTGGKLDVPTGNVNVGTLSTASATTQPASSAAVRGVSIGFDANPEKGWIQVLRNNATEIRDLELQPLGGNVGIGTTSPDRQLTVVGNSGLDIRSSSNYFVNLNYAYGADTAGLYALNSSGGVAKLAINPEGGYVGIGKTSPTVALDVVGSINLTGTINAKYQDVAEWVPTSEKLSAGTVVVLDSTKSNQVTSSTTSYDTRVAGVVSEQPGIALGEKSDNKVLVATTGRVKVKVDASKGPIHIGDLLVTSDTPGVAMKSEAVNLAGVQFHRPGTLIGKALEPLEKGKGEILVLLSLQ